MAYYGKIDRPLAEALALITGTIPSGLDGVYHHRQLNEEASIALEDWCEAYRPAWTTGHGVLEAAEALVLCALENDNIEGYKEFVRYFDT